MKTYPHLSLETAGHSNAVVFHDGHGNRTVLCTQDDEPLPGRYAEFEDAARELENVNLVEHFRDWVHSICCEGRHDHWKAILLDMLIERAGLESNSTP
jgi:hypothetical protein